MHNSLLLLQLRTDFQSRSSRLLSEVLFLATSLCHFLMPEWHKEVAKRRSGIRKLLKTALLTNCSPRVPGTFKPSPWLVSQQSPALRPVPSAQMAEWHKEAAKNSTSDCCPGRFNLDLYVPRARCRACAKVAVQLRTFTVTSFAPLVEPVPRSWGPIPRRRDIAV